MRVAILIALAACTTTSDTRVHLAVTAPALALDHYQILVGDRAAVAQPLAELDVEVPGELAGSAQMLDVWGLDGGQQVAFGTTSVTPIEHQTVTAEVTLAAASCGSACMLGDTECAGSGTSTCQLVGSCLEFGPPTACGNGEVCSAGACGAPPACDGSACDDGNPCTIDDACTAGACTGTPKCTTAPANASPTCAADGSCDFVCNNGYQRSGSACVVPATRELVFLSSHTWDGNLGGLAGADAKCEAAATAAGLGGTFKAWLSDSTTSAASRLAHATVPYVLVSGAMVANSWSDLTGGSIRRYIDVDETGTSHDESLVWTDTEPSGAITSAASSGNCDNWTNTSTSGAARVGDTTWLDNHWSAWGNEQGCDSQAQLHLYCVQQ